jgi:hypothetical protein
MPSQLAPPEAVTVSTCGAMTDAIKEWFYRYRQAMNPVSDGAL